MIFQNAVRGSVGFALSSVYALLGCRFDPVPPLGGFTGPAVGFVLNGIVGAFILNSGGRGRTARGRGALGFGLGYLFPALLTPLALMSFAGAKGGDGIPIAMFGLGFAFGLAGAVGAPFALAGRGGGPARSALAGAGSFGLGGVIAGIFLASVPISGSVFGLGGAQFSFFAAAALAGAVGGGLLEAFAGRLEERAGDRAEAGQFPAGQGVPKRRFLSSAAQLAAGIGLAALLAAVPEYLGLQRIKNLLPEGADPNRSLESESWHGTSGPTKTLLHQAAMEGDRRGAAYLIEHGADVNLRRSDGWTPLLLAVFNKQQRVAEELLARGADVNLAADDGTTPLLMALTWHPKQTGLIELLLNRGADSHALGGQGETALELADRLALGDLVRRYSGSAAAGGGGKASAAPGAAAPEDYRTINSKKFSAQVKAMPPGERRKYLESLRGEPAVVSLGIAEIDKSPSRDGTYRVHSINSNGVEHYVYGVPAETARNLEEYQLLRVRGRIRAVYFPERGLQIHMQPGAEIESMGSMRSEGLRGRPGF
ncbi:MAG: ankyrin repeat domain-containing protein [Elusimicrobia bacterium]|nr:ankyrin repeat domain-containing protein [Elusimicrobiota bacterium]